MVFIEWEIPYFIGSIYEDKRLLIYFMLLFNNKYVTVWTNLKGLIVIVNENKMIIINHAHRKNCLVFFNLGEVELWILQAPSFAKRNRIPDQTSESLQKKSQLNQKVATPPHQEKFQEKSIIVDQEQLVTWLCSHAYVYVLQACNSFATWLHCSKQFSQGMTFECFSTKLNYGLFLRR